MSANLKTISLILAAPVQNGISLLQSNASAGNLTITGSLATGGVATMDVARRVGITSMGNDSGLTWTITGTDRYGRAQSESIAGANDTVAQSTRDFLTVTKIASSGATASTVEAGTTGTASTVPVVVDYFVNRGDYNCICTNPGGDTYSIEGATDDFAPSYDMTVNSPAWVAQTNFNAITAVGPTQGLIQGPLTLLRLTITAGTGLVTARIAFPFVAGMA